VLVDSTNVLFNTGGCDCPFGESNCVSDVAKLWSRLRELDLPNGEYKLVISFGINTIILEGLA